MLAEEALQEINNARAASPDARFQLGWRWIRRYRELSAYDADWWWAPAGPFTDEEQQQWEKMLVPEWTMQRRIGSEKSLCRRETQS